MGDPTSAYHINKTIPHAIPAILTWKKAFVPNRRAYFMYKCVAKGVRPFHRDRTPSSLAVVLAVTIMPLYLLGFSCIRVLIVSIGCRVQASIRPPMDPAKAFRNGVAFLSAFAPRVGGPAIVTRVRTLPAAPIAGAAVVCMG